MSYRLLFVAVLALPLSSCASTAALSPAVATSRDLLTPPTPLTGLPPLGQAAIDLAMRHYRITLPDGVAAPTYAPTLTDRGQTNWQSFVGVTSVKIGPSAFTSWALLASTLAHEIEVHCRQDLFYIATTDALGLPTKLTAEREAYQHELRGAVRFGLSDDEVERIAATMAQLR